MSADGGTWRNWARTVTVTPQRVEQPARIEELQQCVKRAAAAGLAAGDRVWFRHAKSGELAERVNSFAVVDGGSVTAVLPTYRGEGKAFL